MLNTIGINQKQEQIIIDIKNNLILKKFKENKFKLKNTFKAQIILKTLSYYKNKKELSAHLN